MFFAINSNNIVVGIDKDPARRYILGSADSPVTTILPGGSAVGVPFDVATKYPSNQSTPNGKTVGLLRPVTINENNDVLSVDGYYWVGGGGARQQLPRGPYNGAIWALDMNNSRTSVGVIGQNAVAGKLSGLQAVKWLPDGTIVPLNFNGGVPLRINDDGDIVGEDANFRGVLYTGGVARDLNTLLSNTVPGTIGTATGISQDGKIVAIVTSPTDTIRSVLLTPDPVTPPPSISSYAEAALNEPRSKKAAALRALSTPGTLSAIAPTGVAAGSADFQLTVTGAGFQPGTLVYWNGSALATTYVSAGEVKGKVPAALVTLAGSTTITTVNPGDGPSNAYVFTIANPTATITTLTPALLNAGGALDRTLTIDGTGFIPASQVYWNGAPLMTTYVSAARLQAAVPAAKFALPGTAAITVSNPNPGASSSAPKILPVGTPAPVLTSMDVTSAIAGSPQFNLTLTGSGFNPTSFVLWEGQALATTYLGPTSLRAVVPATLLATADSAGVRVSDSIPDTRLSQSLQFDINNPNPQVTGTLPSSVAEGAAGITLTVNGTGFVTGSRIYLDDHRVPTSFVSSTQLKANLTAADILLVAGKPATNVRVKNPPPVGIAWSSAVPLTIVAAPKISSLTPAMARRGTSTLAVTVTGSGFTNLSKVTFQGAALTTTFVSATQLTATLAASNMATAGDFAVRVVQGNPSDPTAGVSDPIAFSVSAAAPGVPTLTSITPISVVAGSKNQVITVNGTGFTSGTVALWEGEPMLTAYVTPTQLMFLAPAAKLVTPGTANIRVKTAPDNTSAGGGTSAGVAKFNILSSAGSSVQIVATNALYDYFPYFYASYMVTLTNRGTGVATNVMVTTAKIGNDSAFGLPYVLGTILPGESIQVPVNVNLFTVPPGPAVLAITGTYQGGSFSSNARIVLP